MLISKTVTLKVSSKTLKYYTELGYNVRHNETIEVSVEHLTNGSHADVDVMCDFCGEIIRKKYKSFLKQRKVIGVDCCLKCASKKNKMTGGGICEYMHSCAEQ